MTALYVPPTDEADHKKQNQSLQLIGGVVSGNTTAIAALQTGTVTTIAGNSGAFTLSTGLANIVNALRVSLTTASNVLGADVALNSTGTFFDGPSMAQGTSGTWFVSGTVTCTDTANAGMVAKLWDGTTVVSSARAFCTASGQVVITLSGIFTSPAANIRISVNDVTNTTGKILFNITTLSKDSSIWGIRIA